MPSVPEYFKDLAIGATGLPRRNPGLLLEDIFRPRSPSPEAALLQLFSGGLRGAMTLAGGRGPDWMTEEREREPEEVEPAVAGGGGAAGGGGGRRRGRLASAGGGGAMREAAVASAELGDGRERESLNLNVI